MTPFLFFVPDFVSSVSGYASNIKETVTTKVQENVSLVVSIDRKHENNYLCCKSGGSEIRFGKGFH